MRGKIHHQRGVTPQGFQVGQFVKLHAVDGFVAADVHIATVRTDLPRGGGRQAGEPVGLGRSGHACNTVFTGFFVRLLTPAARQHKIHGPALRQVERHDGILSQAAALHEQNLEMGGHRQQFTQVCFGLLVDADELLASVAHLHHAHARALPVQHFGRSLLQNGLGHDGGPRRKIERSAHALFRSRCAVVGRSIRITLGGIRVVFDDALQA